MRVRCPSCTTIYRAADELIGKRMRCKKCNEIFDVSPVDEPAAASALEEAPSAEPESAPESTREPRARRGQAEPQPVTTGQRAMGITGIVIGTGVVPLTIAGLVLVSVRFDVQPYNFGFAPVLWVIVSLGMICGGIGLLFGKSWGWWSTLFSTGLGVIDQGRLYAPLVGLIQWESPLAWPTFWELLLAVCFLCLPYIGLVVWMTLPKMRLAYGIKKEPRKGGRTAGRTGGRSRRSAR